MPELDDGVGRGKLQAMGWLQIAVNAEAELHLALVRIAIDQQLSGHVEVQVLRGDLADAQHLDLSGAVVARLDQFVEPLDRQVVQVDARQSSWQAASLGRLSCASRFLIRLDRA